MRLFTLAAMCAALVSFPSVACAEWQRDGEAWVYVADVRPTAKSDCSCGTACACAPGACPAACPVVVLPDVRDAVADSAPVAGHYVQQCDGRSCRWVWVADASPAAGKPVVAAASAPVSEASPRRSGPVRRIFGRLFSRVRGGGCCGG